MSTQTRYPYRDGDVLVLGPEIFVSSDGEVICWQGVNYVRRDKTFCPLCGQPAVIVGRERGRGTTLIHCDDCMTPLS